MAEAGEPAGDAAGERRAAYYAVAGHGARQWWTLLHPPYTAWHLGYVVIGACLATKPSLAVLGWTLLAFFLAVGVAAHALDELNGRPLRTGIPSRSLLIAAILSLLAAAAVGTGLALRAGWSLVPFLVAGPVLVVAYNAELLGGIVHNDLGFAVIWGAFPVLAAYDAQTGKLALAPLVAAGGALALSAAQRRLSTPARQLRRHATRVEGVIELDDGTARHLDEAALLAPLEGALRASSWGVVLIAAALALARLG